MRACCPNCGSERHYNVPATDDCRRHIQADAYERGRADERADAVAWLLEDAPGLADTRAHQAALIRTASHVGAAKKEKP